MNKICNCNKEEITFHKHLNTYRCQYCGGIVKYLDKVLKYIDYNTPINIKDRNKIINKTFFKHKEVLSKLIKIDKTAREV